MYIHKTSDALQRGRQPRFANDKRLPTDPEGSLASPLQVDIQAEIAAKRAQLRATPALKEKATASALPTAPFYSLPASKPTIVPRLRKTASSSTLWNSQLEPCEDNNATLLPSAGHATEPQTPSHPLRRTSSSSILPRSVSCFSLDQVLDSTANTSPEKVAQEQDDLVDSSYNLPSFYMHHGHDLSMISERTEPMSPTKRSMYDLHATPRSCRTISSPLPRVAEPETTARLSHLPVISPLPKPWTQDKVAQSDGALSANIDLTERDTESTIIRCNLCSIPPRSLERPSAAPYPTAPPSVHRRSTSWTSTVSSSKSISAMPRWVIPDPPSFRHRSRSYSQSTSHEEIAHPIVETSMDGQEITPLVGEVPAHIRAGVDASRDKSSSPATESTIVCGQNFPLHLNKPLPYPRAESPLTKLENMVEQEASRVACLIGAPVPDPDPATVAAHHTTFHAGLTQFLAENEARVSITKLRRASTQANIREKAQMMPVKPTSPLSQVETRLRKMSDTVRQTEDLRKDVDVAWDVVEGSAGAPSEARSASETSREIAGNENPLVAKKNKEKKLSKSKGMRSFSFWRKSTE